MKTLLLPLFILLIIFIAMSVVLAQPPGFPTDNPPQAPIDGGLGLLAAAGGAYALKKLREQKGDELK